MKSYNHVTLVGNLAADPELRQTKNGRTVASFPLAINRNSLDEEGKRHEVADYHRIVAWEKLGNIAAKYLAKGSAVLIDGRLINTSFDDSKGQKHYRTEIVLDDLRMLTPKKTAKGSDAVSVESMPESEEKVLV